MDLAELIKEEITGVRLYSGPMYEKYNTVLRAQGEKSVADRAANGGSPRAPGLSRDGSRPPSLAAQRSTKGLFRPGAGQETNAAAPAKAKSKTGFMQGRLKEMCGDNYYVTTIHAINSCVIKLSKLTVATQVWRGLSASLPKKLLEYDEFGVRGGVEFGFTSTSTKASVAVGYATLGKKAPLVIRIAQGHVDRGADIHWLSQFPGEGEVLFPPLLSLQVRSSVVAHDLLVIELRPSVNMTSLTLDAVKAKRHRLVRDMGHSMQIELESTMRSGSKVEWDHLTSRLPRRASDGTLAASEDPHRELARDLQRAVLSVLDGKEQAFYNEDLQLGSSIRTAVDVTRAISAWPSEVEQLLTGASMRELVLTKEAHHMIEKCGTSAVVLADDHMHPELHLAHKGLGDAGASALGVVLYTSGGLSALRRLNLRANKLSDAGGLLLFHAFLQLGAPVLNFLDVSHNLLGDDAMQLLAAVIERRRLPELAELNIFQNVVGDVGLTALAEALAPSWVHEREQRSVDRRQLPCPQLHDIEFEANHIQQPARIRMVETIALRCRLLGEAVAAPDLMPDLRARFVLDAHKFQDRSKSLQSGSLTIQTLVGISNPVPMEGMHHEHAPPEAAQKDQRFFSHDRKHDFSTTPKIEWFFVTQPARSTAGQPPTAADALLSEHNLLHFPGESHDSPHREAASGPVHHGRVPCEWTDSEVQHSAKAINVRLSSLNLKALQQVEWIAARLYTGPMGAHYNEVLAECSRESAKLVEERAMNSAQNTYPTTIAVLSSSIYKLSKVAGQMRVYRPVDEYSETLKKRIAAWRPGEHSCVEHGFLSTIANNDTAFRHAATRSAAAAASASTNPVDGDTTTHACGTVIEMEQDLDSPAADLSWLSMYPEESEWVYPPLTALSILERTKMGSIEVVRARPTCLLRLQTIEEIAGLRKTRHLELIKLLEAGLLYAGVPAQATKPLLTLRRSAARKPPAWFNSDANFRQSTEQGLKSQHEALDSLSDPKLWAAAESQWRMDRNVEAAAGGNEADVKAAVDKSDRDAAVQARDLAEKMRRAARICADSGKHAVAVRLLQMAQKKQPDIGYSRDETAAARVKGLVDSVVTATTATPADHADNTLGNKIRLAAWILLHERLQMPWPGTLLELLNSSDGVDGAGVSSSAASARSLVDAFGQLVKKARQEGLIADPFEVQKEELRQHPLLIRIKNGSDLTSTRIIRGRLLAVHASKKFEMLLANRTTCKVEACKVLAPDTGLGALLCAASAAGRTELVGVLLDADVSPQESKEDGTTALIAAANAGHANVCLRLLEAGADIDMRNQMGLNAFDCAVFRRHYTVRRALKPNMLTIDMKPIANGQGGESARSAGSRLLLAAVHGDADAIRKRASVMGAGANLDATVVHNVTPLMIAAHGGHIECVEALLQLNADVNLQSRSGATALMFAADSAQKVVEHLLLADAKIDLQLWEFDKKSDGQKKLGKTALMLACEVGNTLAVSSLLKYGASVNLATDDKRTALMLASMFGNLEEVKLLLEHHASVDEVKSAHDSSTALSFASRYGQEQVVMTLLEHRADPNGDRKSPPLLKACQTGHVAIARALIDGGANVNVGNYDTQTALILASKNGWVKTVQLLTEEPGIKINFEDKFKRTALWYACANGHEPVVRQLLTGGERAAKINVRDEVCNPATDKPHPESNSTPLHVVCCEGFERLVHVLLEHQRAAKDGVWGLLRSERHDGHTALILASEMGHEDTVRMTLQYAADVGKLEACLQARLEVADAVEASKKERGVTSLLVAAKDGHVGVVIALLQAAQEAGSAVLTKVVNQLDGKGNSALLLAVRERRREVVLEIVRALLMVATTDAELSDLMNAPNDAGETAMHLATNDSQIEQVFSSLLIERSAAAASAPAEEWGLANSGSPSMGRSRFFGVGSSSRRSRLALRMSSSSGAGASPASIVGGGGTAEQWRAVTSLDELIQVSLAGGDANAAAGSNAAGGLRALTYDAKAVELTRKARMILSPPWPTDEDIVARRTYAGPLVTLHRDVHLQGGPHKSLWLRVRSSERHEPPMAETVLDAYKLVHEAVHREGKPVNIYLALSEAAARSETLQALRNEKFAFHHHRFDRETRRSESTEFVYHHFTGDPRKNKVPPYATSIEGAAALVFSADETRVLAVWERHGWGCVGGAVNEGEGKASAIRRELWEEVKLRTDDNFMFFLGGYSQYRARDDLVNDNFSMFVMKVTDDNFEVDNHEIHEATWLPWKEVLRVWKAAGKPTDPFAVTPEKLDPERKLENPWGEKLAALGVCKKTITDEQGQPKEVERGIITKRLLNCLDAWESNKRLPCKYEERKGRLLLGTI